MLAALAVVLRPVALICGGHQAVALENLALARWGYQRIVGELKGLGVAVSATTVRTWLRKEGLGPAGTRGGMTWREFLRAHRRRMLAVDFFTVETIWLQRLYVRFFIELGSRRVHVAGCTPNPSALWVTQQARQLTWTLADRPESFRFLIRDRDRKFTNSFDEVFRSDGTQIIRTPFRAPQANGVAERFVRTVRSECLDWLLILTQQHLQRVLDVFVDHYNGHRPHRALALNLPHPTCPPFAPATEWGEARVQRRDRLGVWFTSTSWRRDQFSAPYSLPSGKNLWRGVERGSHIPASCCVSVRFSGAGAAAPASVAASHQSPCPDNHAFQIELRNLAPVGQHRRSR